MRLVNQKMFTRSSDGVGAKVGLGLSGGLSALADAFSWADMRVNRATVASSGSERSQR